MLIWIICLPLLDLIQKYKFQFVCSYLSCSICSYTVFNSPYNEHPYINVVNESHFVIVRSPSIQSLRACSVHFIVTCLSSSSFSLTNSPCSAFNLSITIVIVYLYSFVSFSFYTFSSWSSFIVFRCYLIYSSNSFLSSGHASA